MTKLVSIYALVNPLDGRVRYIGSTTNPKKRLAETIAQAKQRAKAHPGWRDSQRYGWVIELCDSGLKPEMRVLERCSASYRSERENWWIDFYQNQGVELANAISASPRYDI